VCVVCVWCVYVCLCVCVCGVCVYVCLCVCVFIRQEISHWFHRNRLYYSTQFTEHTRLCMVWLRYWLKYGPAQCNITLLNWSIAMCLWRNIILNSVRQHNHFNAQGNYKATCFDYRLVILRPILSIVSQDAIHTLGFNLMYSMDVNTMGSQIVHSILWHN